MVSIVELVGYIVLCGGLSFVAGVFIGSYLEDKHWAGRGDTDVMHRTAVCWAGKFYYVVPESEYNKITLDAMAAKDRK